MYTVYFSENTVYVFFKLIFIKEYKNAVITIQLLRYITYVPAILSCNPCFLAVKATII